MPEIESATVTATAPAVGSDRWYLAAAPIPRALIHLAVPMAAAMIVSAVYNVINAGFIGSLHDTALLAAITFGTPILGLIMGVGGVFGTGGGALISRLLGAESTDRTAAEGIKRGASFALWGSVGGGIACAATGLLFVHPLVTLLGAPPAAAAATASYTAVMLAFMPVLTTAVCLEQLVRSVGAARQSMIGLIVSTVANLVFDVLFILVLGWGVAGAAAAVGLANAVSVIYFVDYLRRHGSGISLSPHWFTLARRTIGPVLSVGVSELLQSSFLIVTSLVLNTLTAGYGDGPVAAMGVAVRIAQVPEFLVMGVTIGVLPLLAFAFGGGDHRRLAGALRTSAVTIGAITLLFTAIAFAFRHQILAVFLTGNDLLSIGSTILTAQLISMIFNGFTGLVTSLFQATGRALAATVLSLTQGIAFIPIVLLANLWFGLSGIIWALTASEALVLLVGLTLWLAHRPQPAPASPQSHHRQENNAEPATRNEMA